MLQVQLKVVDGKHAGKIIPLTENKFLIGREEDCHLRPNSDLVSRHHCMFSVDQFKVFLRDLGSTNGTFVNGERLRGKTELQTGDKVAVGKLHFEIAVNEATEEEVVAEAPAPAADETSEAASQDTVSLESSETSYELPVQDASAGDSTIIGMPVMPPMDANGQPMYPQQQMPMLSAADAHVSASRLPAAVSAAVHATGDVPATDATTDARLSAARYAGATRAGSCGLHRNRVSRCDAPRSEHHWRSGTAGTRWRRWRWRR